MKKYLLTCFIVSAISTLYAASANWTGLKLEDITYDDPFKGFKLNGHVSSSDGRSSQIYGQLYGFEVGNKYYLESEYYEITAAPITTKWFLAFYGDVVSETTISDLDRISRFFYPDDPENGTLIDDRTDFYLAFTTEEYGVVDPMVWYGWVHLSVDEVGMMSVLSSGIGLNGESVAVGQLIPEPSGGLLFILGAAALGLRRRIGRGDCPRFGPFTILGLLRI